MSKAVEIGETLFSKRFCQLSEILFPRDGGTHHYPGVNFFLVHCSMTNWFIEPAKYKVKTASPWPWPASSFRRTAIDESTILTRAFLFGSGISSSYPSSRNRRRSWWIERQPRCLNFRSVYSGGPSCSIT